MQIWQYNTTHLLMWHQRIQYNTDKVTQYNIQWSYKHNTILHSTIQYIYTIQWQYNTTCYNNAIQITYHAIYNTRYCTLYYSMLCNTILHSEHAVQLLHGLVAQCSQTQRILQMLCKYLNAPPTKGVSRPSINRTFFSCGPMPWQWCATEHLRKWLVRLSIR